MRKIGTFFFFFYLPQSSTIFTTRPALSHDFRALRSGERRIWYNLETSIDGLSGSKIAKKLVGYYEVDAREFETGIFYFMLFFFFVSSQEEICLSAKMRSVDREYPISNFSFSSSFYYCMLQCSPIFHTIVNLSACPYCLSVCATIPPVCPNGYVAFNFSAALM